MSLYAVLLAVHQEAKKVVLGGNGAGAERCKAKMKSEVASGLKNYENNRSLIKKFLVLQTGTTRLCQLSQLILRLITARHSMLEPPSAMLKIEPLQLSRDTLIEQANLRIPISWPPTNCQFTFHQQPRFQLLNFPTLGIRVEGMLDDLATMVDHIHSTDIGIVAEFPMRGARETALRWSVGEVEVS